MHISCTYGNCLCIVVAWLGGGQDRPSKAWLRLQISADIVLSGLTAFVANDFQPLYIFHGMQEFSEANARFMSSAIYKL